MLRFLFLLICGGCFAQAPSPKDSIPTAFVPEIALGAKGSFLLSRLNFSPSVSQSFLMEIGGGLVFKYAAQRALGIQLELNYAPKGWQEQYADPNQLYSRKLYYLEMPFMTNIFLGKRHGFFVFNAGPVLSYLMRDVKFYNNNSPLVLDYYDDPIENRVELGICGGLGILIKTPGGHIQLEGRYSHNFLNIFGTRTFSSSQTQSISASLAYMWAFTPKTKTKAEPQTKTEPKPKEPKKPKEKKPKKGEEVPINNEKIRGGSTGS